MEVASLFALSADDSQLTAGQPPAPQPASAVKLIAPASAIDAIKAIKLIRCIATPPFLVGYPDRPIAYLRNGRTQKVKKQHNLFKIILPTRCTFCFLALSRGH